MEVTAVGAMAIPTSPSRAALSSAALYREHARRVAGWASRLGGPRRHAELEDVVQEVFLRVHRALPGFRGDAEITTWLYRITENTVRARLRKERVRRFLGFLPATDVDATEIPTTAPSPEGEVERMQRVRLLYAALDRVSDTYRTPFILFEIEGTPGEEIARLLGIKLPTLWVRLTRARALVTAELKRATKEDRRARSD